MNNAVVGYCAGPLVFCLLKADAPWIVTVISGALGSAWYGVQLYKAWKGEKKDDVPPPPR